MIKFQFLPIYNLNASVCFSLLMALGLYYLVQNLSHFHFVNFERFVLSSTPAKHFVFLFYLFIDHYENRKKKQKNRKFHFNADKM